MASKLLLAIPIGFILDSCSNYSASKEKSSPELIKVVFDVPALLGKNIDEIRKILSDTPIEDISVWEKQGNLTETDKRYSIKAIDLDRKHLKFTGIIITPSK